MIAVDGVDLTWPMLLVALGAAVAVGLVTGRRTRTAGLWLSLALSLALIAALTLGFLVGGTSGQAGGVNLVPFQEIQRGLDNRGSSPWRNLVGNVVLFMPFGASVAGLIRGRFWRRVVTATVLGAVLSASIEVAQHWGGRVADIDDIILNTAGALVGAVLAATLAASTGATRRPGRTLEG